jgi:hypothetical protein
MENVSWKHFEKSFFSKSCAEFFRGKYFTKNLPRVVEEFRWFTVETDNNNKNATAFDSPRFHLDVTQTHSRKVGADLVNTVTYLQV